MDVETAQREFDRIGKKDLPSLEEVAERGRLRKIRSQHPLAEQYHYFLHFL
jgi:hypothetical protein